MTEDAATIARLRERLQDEVSAHFRCADSLHAAEADVARLTQQIEALKKPAQAHCASCTDPQCWGTRQPALLRAEQAESEVARLRQERDEARQIAFTADGEHVLIPNELSMPELVRSLVRAVNEAESALAALREATTWQPISSAPKDGTWILGFGGNCGQTWPIKWSDSDGGEWTDLAYAYGATHWMPLPPPPPEEPR